MQNSVARAVLNVYGSLPSNGKPKPTEEFSVLAGIVACIDNSSFVVLSVATGTKCVGADVCEHHGCVVHDSHAEILARRGFIRYLGKVVESLLCNTQIAGTRLCPLEVVDSSVNSSSGPRYKVKSNWSFHLYVSDSPCGDASIYDITSVTNNGSSFTGAKLIKQIPSVERTQNESSSRESGEQSLGVVRTKSGRSDISAERRTTSMSCSDKIARWIVLGLQGPMLSLWIEPVCLSSVIVGRDPAALNEESQSIALNRALLERVTSTGLSVIVPALHIVSDAKLQFNAGKGMMKHNMELMKQTKASAAVNSSGNSDVNGDFSEPANKKRRKNEDSIKPCGNSINWIVDICPPCDFTGNVTDGTGASSSGSTSKRRERTVSCQGGSVEVTIAHTGALQGATKSSIQGREAASRLCRRETLTAFVETTGVALQKGNEDCRRVVSELVDRCTATSEGRFDTDVPANNLEKLRNTPYHRVKRHCSAVYSERRAAFLASEAFRGWLVDDPEADSAA